MSFREAFDDGAAAVGGNWGVLRADDEATIWLITEFEGRMLRLDDVGTGGGGMACKDDSRRSAASSRGDIGTLFRSGISTLWVIQCGVQWGV